MRQAEYPTPLAEHDELAALVDDQTPDEIPKCGELRAVEGG